MKRVIFTTDDFELRLEADFSDAAEGEPGVVRVQANGNDYTGDDPVAAEAWGTYSPTEAREIATYFIQMADEAERGRK